MDAEKVLERAARYDVGFQPGIRFSSANGLNSFFRLCFAYYGDDDLEDIMKNTKARAAAAEKAGNKNFSQVEIAGSNHFFDGTEDELVSAVAKWLQQLAEQ